MAFPDDFKLIREIVAAGGSRYTTGTIDRSRYQRLVDLGWARRISHQCQRRQLSGYRTWKGGCGSLLMLNDPSMVIAVVFALALAILTVALILIKRVVRRMM